MEASRIAPMLIGMTRAMNDRESDSSSRVRLRFVFATSFISARPPETLTPRPIKRYTVNR